MQCLALESQNFNPYAQLKGRKVRNICSAVF